MNNVQLNLARKWRSKKFDEIIGQELAVRILKNSLYKDYFFPVYLFAGQKGCGKTTAARVFSAAINCSRLPDFQKQPRSTMLPCLECGSCQSMLTQSHPDFIEIDAASHTGVDNVRNIIDSSSLLPTVGRKKIYLIDEAHMLSKAAFNAFLKILEEPVPSVLFILATTDTEKIIETVRSRCFQVFFYPIKSDVLQKHLFAICKAEEIPIEASIITMIASHAKGSARDALNMLEQIRFAGGKICKQAVLQILGFIDDSRLLDLFLFTLEKKPHKILNFLKEESIDNYSAKIIWQGIVELIRTAIWIKYDIDPPIYHEYYEILRGALLVVSVAQLHNMLKLFYHYEEAFFTTTQQYVLLEMILLQLCDIDNSFGSSPSNGPVAPAIICSENRLSPAIQESEEYIDCYQQKWNTFKKQLATLKDPLLSSLFEHALYKYFHVDADTLQIEFSKQFQFFQEWIHDSAAQWEPIFKNTFTDSTKLDMKFSDEAETSNFSPIKIKSMEGLYTNQKVTSQVQSTYKNIKEYGTHNRKGKKYSSIISDNVGGARVSEHELSQFPQAALILQHFPGMLVYANIDVPITIDYQKKRLQMADLALVPKNSFTSHESKVYA